MSSLARYRKLFAVCTVNTKKISVWYSEGTVINVYHTDDVFFGVRGCFVCEIQYAYRDSPDIAALTLSEYNDEPIPKRYNLRKEYYGI